MTRSKRLLPAGRTKRQEPRRLTRKRPALLCPDAAVERLLQNRWTCTLCCEIFAADRAAWALTCCETERVFCGSCLNRCAHDSGVCPYDREPIPLLVMCGLSTSASEFIGLTKAARARQEHLFQCEHVHCHGLLEEHADRPYRTCDVCGTKFCANRQCRAVHTLDHKCATEDDHCALLSPPVRRCPGCNQWIDKVDGCDIVFHAECRTAWCFRCGQDASKSGCRHGRCASAKAQTRA